MEDNNIMLTHGSDDVEILPTSIAVSDEEFVENKPHILEALSSTSRRKRSHDRNYYRNLNQRYKLDPDIALAALTYSCSNFAKWHDIPNRLIADPGFCARAISSGMNVPVHDMKTTDLMGDDFLQNLSIIHKKDHLVALLHKSPDLARDKRFLAAVTNSFFTVNNCFFTNYATPTILSDYDLMVSVLSSGTWFPEPWEYVDVALLNNPVFCKDVLDHNPFKLVYTTAILSRFPHIFVDYFEIAMRKVQDEFLFNDTLSMWNQVIEWTLEMADQIPQSLWDNNRHVVRAWFKGGGSFISEYHQKYKNDPLIGFWLCKYYFPKDDGVELVENFRQAVPALLNDKEYMNKAIYLNPHVFHAASNNLQRDFSIQLIAFGQIPGQYPYMTDRTGPDLHYRMVQFREKATEELQWCRNMEFLKQNLKECPADLIAASGFLPSEERVKKLHIAMENVAAVHESRASWNIRSTRSN
jgi:hypothetical protein